MIVLVVGTLLIAASLLYLAFKLRVAYDVGAEPENAGGVPTLDGLSGAKPPSGRLSRPSVDVV